MGTLKQDMLEEHSDDTSSTCDRCGDSLNQEAQDAGRTECFDCYSDSQD